VVINKYILAISLTRIFIHLIHLSFRTTALPPPFLLCDRKPPLYHLHSLRHTHKDEVAAVTPYIDGLDGTKFVLDMNYLSSYWMKVGEFIQLKVTKEKSRISDNVE
jgi:hypothetical protein